MNLTEHILYLFLIAATFQTILARKRLRKYRGVSGRSSEKEVDESFEKGLKRVDDVAYILIKAHKKGGDDIYLGAIYDLFESYYMSLQKSIYSTKELIEEDANIRPMINKELEYYNNKLNRLLDAFAKAGIYLDIKIVYENGAQVKKRSVRNRRNQKNKRPELKKHEGDELKRADVAASIIADAYHSDDEKINPDAVYDLFESYYEGLENRVNEHISAATLLPDDVRKIFKERIDKYQEMAKRFMEKLQKENVNLKIVKISLHK